MIPLVIEQKMDAICKENDELKRDVNRLNNIINELEKWVKERIDNVKYNDYDDMLDKLKELKEGNKQFDK